MSVYLITIHYSLTTCTITISNRLIEYVIMILDEFVVGKVNQTTGTIIDFFMMSSIIRWTALLQSWTVSEAKGYRHISAWVATR